MTRSTPPSPLPKKRYSAPVLTNYGKFSQLTASGSGRRRERNMGMGQPRRRP